MSTIKNINKFQKMSIYFFIYAFLGWVAEELYCIISTHTIVNRGFLFGPICPMYGYGALILILCLDKYKNKPFKLFLISSIIFSIFEYITDFFLQALFATRFWDYTGYFLNLNSRITLSFSLVWGIRQFNFHKNITSINYKITSKNFNKDSFKTSAHIDRYFFILYDC